MLTNQQATRHTRCECGGSASQNAVQATFLMFPFAPLVLMLRFLVAAPISWIAGGRFREWLLRSVSSLKMNPGFEWRNISAEQRRLAVLQDAACWCW